MRIKPKIDEILSNIQKPLSYVACEQNSVFKKGALLNFCLVFPDLYELGINSLGINILYSTLNREKDIWAQRAYAPSCDMVQELSEKNEAMFSLEEARPLNEFDILGFSLPHELCYTNILKILKTSKIALRREQRDDNQPIIIAGGCGSFNPVVLAPFIDTFVIGDGEEVIVEIGKKILELKTKNRDEKLKALSEINGVWVPAYPKDTQRRIIQDINKVRYDSLVPVFKSEKRTVVEIARGCSAGCRFCQAGFIYRPLREKDAKIAYKEAIEKNEKAALPQLSLLSLSTSDYSQLESLINNLMNDFEQKNVSVSLPSMRIDDFSLDILTNISKVKKTGLTFAVEAGSQRLRNLINKRLSEKQIIGNLRKVFANGWHKVKLYFMVGLPTENDDDLNELVELVYRIRKVAKESLPANLRRKLNITISVSNFVPKPHTPFQWVAQDNLNKLETKHNFLKKNIRGASLNLKWHNPKQSLIEGLFARGDGKISDLLEQAFIFGAGLDNFSEFFDFNIWSKAIDKCGIKINEYLKERSTKEPLPWDFIKTGISKDYLLSEYAKSFNQDQTPDCRNKCPKCGLCDKKIKNTFSRKLLKTKAKEPVKRVEKEKYRVVLRRDGLYKYLSHLDWIALIECKLRQSGLDLVHKGKFNPRPKISYSPALPVGYFSDYEIVDFFLYDPPDENEINSRLQKAFTNGLGFISLENNPGKINFEKVDFEVLITGDKIISDLKYRIRKNKALLVKVEKRGNFLSVDMKKCILKVDINNDGEGGKLDIRCPINIRPDLMLKSYANANKMDIGIKSVKKVFCLKQENNDSK